MKQTICTIPVSDVFTEKNGCPFCNLRKKLETSYAQYITGDAKMEPTVRIATNKVGFCKEHFSLMSQIGSRLSNALILESHLQYIIDNCFSDSQNPKAIKSQALHGETLAKSCFICENVDEDVKRAMETTVKLFHNDESFKKLFLSQPFFCLEDFSLLIKTADTILKKKEFIEFADSAREITLKYLRELKGDVTHFCSMFDYRNAGGDFKNSKDSIERSRVFLCGPFEQDSSSD